MENTYPANLWHDLMAYGNQPKEPDIPDDIDETIAYFRSFLPERYWTALTMYYKERRPASEIGAALGVCPSRARQIVASALRLIRRRAWPNILKHGLNSAIEMEQDKVKCPHSDNPSSRIAALNLPVKTGRKLTHLGITHIIDLQNLCKDELKIVCGLNDQELKTIENALSTWGIVLRDSIPLPPVQIDRSSPISVFPIENTARIRLAGAGIFTVGAFADLPLSERTRAIKNPNTVGEIDSMLKASGITVNPAFVR